LLSGQGQGTNPSTCDMGLLSILLRLLGLLPPCK
jgi:hypothetical protein